MEAWRPRRSILIRDSGRRTLLLSQAGREGITDKKGLPVTALTNGINVEIRTFCNFQKYQSDREEFKSYIFNGIGEIYLKMFYIGPVKFYVDFIIDELYVPGRNERIYCLK